MDERRFELRWHHHQSTVVAAVASLYRDEQLVDVTLACEDQKTYQAHKLVLSACSYYFQSLFARFKHYHHPIIFLKDVKGTECEALLAFMYHGEVSVAQNEFERIIVVANSLRVRGLAEMERESPPPNSPTEPEETAQHTSNSSPPSPTISSSPKCSSPPIDRPASRNTPSNPPLALNQQHHPPDGACAALYSSDSTPIPPSHSTLCVGHSTSSSSSLPPPPHSISSHHPLPPPPPAPHLPPSLQAHPGHLPSHSNYSHYSSPIAGHHPLPSPGSSRSSVYHEQLAPTIFYSSLEERKRSAAAAAVLQQQQQQDQDDLKPLTGLHSSYLQVKKNLGCPKNWEGGGSSGAPSDLDSPINSEPPPLPPHHNPYLPPSLFSIISDHHHNPMDTAAFPHWHPNGAFKNMQPRSLLQPIGSEKRGPNTAFSIVDPMLRSTETRLHKCQYCSRKFKRKDHLKTHIRIHTGERPYKCKICNRGFIQSQQVKIHMKVHVREDSSLGMGSASGLCGPGGLAGLGGVGGGGGGGPPLHSMAPIFPPYSDHNSRSASHHSSDSHSDLLDQQSAAMTLDTDNECSSELPDGEYGGLRHDMATSSADRTPPLRHIGSVTSSSSAGNANILSNLVSNNNNNNNNNSHGLPNALTTGSYVSGSISTNNKLAKLSPPSPELPTIISSPTPPSCLTNSSSSTSQQQSSSAHHGSSDDRPNVSLKDASSSSFHLGVASLKK